MQWSSDGSNSKLFHVRLPNINRTLNSDPILSVRTLFGIKEHVREQLTY